MNLYDKIGHLKALQEEWAPLRHVWQSISINRLESSYAMAFGALGLSGEGVENINRLEVHRRTIEASWRSGLSGAVFPSTIESALALVETSKRLTGSLELPSSLRSTREIFDAYQRTTTSLTSGLALTQTQNPWAALGKYRSMAELTDPLRLYRKSLETAFSKPVLELTQEIREMLDALTSIGRDFGSVAVEAESSEGDVEEADVSRLSGFMNETGPGTAAWSTENITVLVRQAVASYQELSSGRDKQIFVTYIYPLILAIAFSLINPYADFVVKQKLESPNKSSEKAVQQAARESGLPAHIIEQFRFVKASRLDVHATGKMRSPTIGVLRFGEPVEVLKKDGDWTLVHYSNSEDDTIIQGWVLSRYLRRYK